MRRLQILLFVAIVMVCTGRVWAQGAKVGIFEDHSDVGTVLHAWVGGL